MTLKKIIKTLTLFAAVPSTTQRTQTGGGIRSLPQNTTPSRSTIQSAAGSFSSQWLRSSEDFPLHFRGFLIETGALSGPLHCAIAPPLQLSFVRERNLCIEDGVFLIQHVLLDRIPVQIGRHCCVRHCNKKLNRNSVRY